jgi:hypothetical protein
MDSLPLLGQKLRHAAAQRPRTLYRPEPLRPLLCPGQQACPTYGRIVNGPFAEFTVTSESDRLMYPLVGVHANPHG